MDIIDLHSFVLHERAAQHYWKGQGLLSIKTFPRGHARYTVGDAKFLVEDTKYLILNHRQDYTVEIDSPVESFCVFFDPKIVSSTYRGLTTTTDQLLTHPSSIQASPPLFYQRTYPQDLHLTRIMNYLRINYPHYSRLWLDEQLQRLLEQMYFLQQMTIGEIDDSLFSIRLTTRQELYGRLHLARDYIEALYAEPLLLSQIASVAALSPNHLLRTFKQLFGQTPHQYMIEVRLQKAKHFLSFTDRSVTDICAEVGFESLGSFSWLFRRRFGQSPRAFRKQLDTSWLPDNQN